MTPRSSALEGSQLPLQGATSGFYEINNVTETAVGNLAGATLPGRSATTRTGHFWKAQVGQFLGAPKHSTNAVNRFSGN